MLQPVVERYDQPDQGESMVVLKTYRYLRLGMVLLMVALVASVLLTRRTADHFEQSISAYYYTPTRAVFVSVLVATGVSLVVIKGRTSLEEWCLNIAGMLAPVIAFVPTTPADTGTLTPAARVDVNNNIGALLIAGWVGLGVATVISATQRDDRDGRRTITDAGTWISLLALLVALMVATATFWWTSGITDYAHGWSAAAMFGALGIAALGNGLGHTAPGRHSTHAGWYIGTGALMLIIGVVYMVTSLLHVQWSYEVLHVEALEISLFVVFWIIQSVERWDWTVSPPRDDAGGTPAP